MGEQTDKLKGRTKQAVGDLTDDAELHGEGVADETAGEAKELVDKVADALHGAIDWVREKLS